MTDWVRLWHDMPTDPKWRTIARKAGQRVGDVIAVFNFLMVDASRNATERGTISEGFDPEDVATALDLDEADVRSIVDAMQGKVLDGKRLCGWEKRQPKREDSTSSQRKEAWKERQRNAAERDGTQRNAPDTESETDIPPKAPRKRRAESKHLLPDDWRLPPIAELTPKAKECAEQWPQGTYEREGEAFECFWRSRRRMMSDWRLTWANRVIDVHPRIVREAQTARQRNGEPGNYLEQYEREMKSKETVPAGARC
jgi:hypothetical protein